MHDALEAEQMYSLMTKLVSSMDQESTFCNAENAIPCIMHCGYCINEKFVHDGSDQSLGIMQQQKEWMLLIKTVGDYLNSGVFGTEQSKA